MYKNIDFIDERQIPKKFRLRGYELTKDIDVKDFVFVSLNEYSKSVLWTGDKKLITGLRSKGYQKIISTEEPAKLRLDLSKKKSK